jgi:nitroimidazol reductase NimA-like FMN-containing flavoprotein (pyridoxamine 5'-phosphate oxidase superfamily)
MTGDKSAEDFTKMRRRGRAVSDENWIKSFLHRAPYGTLAIARDDQPFLNFMAFVYDEKEKAVYFHTALKGRTRTIIEKNPRVCFGVAEIGRFYPGKTAMEFSNEYASVMVYGTVEIIHDRDRAWQALQMLMDKYFPHLRPDVDYRSMTDREIELTSVYRLNIEQWVGKKNRQPNDKKGAFFFENKNEFGKVDE